MDVAIYSLEIFFLFLAYLRETDSIDKLYKNI